MAIKMFPARLLGVYEPKLFTLDDLKPGSIEFWVYIAMLMLRARGPIA